MRVLAAFKLTSFPWRLFFNRLYEKATESDIFNRAAQVAFYFSFSLFPLLFFLISLFGLLLVSADELKGELFDYLRQAMPASVYDLVHKSLEEIVSNSSKGKLTFGLMASLWSASSGIDGIRSALNSVYQLRERRSWWNIKVQSLALTLAVIILITIVLSIVFYGWQMVQFGLASIGLTITSPWVLITIQWISLLLLMLFLCELIYNLLPDFRKFKWDWVSPGAIAAIISWLVLTSGFRLYISYYNNYDKAYGSLGAVIIMMLWLYLTALVIMGGGVINSVLREFAAGTTENS